MSRNASVYLEDILEAVEKIKAYTRGQSLTTLLEDPLRADALVFNLLVIGEAAGYVPKDLRSNYPEVPWRQIVGLRNVIAHQYFQIDLEIVWDIVESELEMLEQTVRVMLSDLREIGRAHV